MIESFIDHRKYRCVPIPIDMFPNLAGHIVGKQGRTLKDMENKTGCTIHLRGKGTRGKGTLFPYDNEPANVFIIGENSEAVDAASMLVESLIVKYASPRLEIHVEENQDLARKPEAEVDCPRDEDSAFWL
jgi:hypothetical protein